MEQTADKSQGWKNSLKIILPYLLIVGTSGAIGLAIAGVDFDTLLKHQLTTNQFFIVQLFNMAGTIGLLWMYRKDAVKESFAWLKLKKPNIGIEVFTGLLLGFVIMISGFCTLILSQQIKFVEVHFQAMELLMSVGLFILVAIGEELFCRWYILSNLMTSFSRSTALILSSIFFSLLHVFNPNFSFIGILEIFVAGLLLGLCYMYTKSIWLPIALHFSWNFFQGPILGFNVSGIDTYSLIVTKFQEENIWNGGSFGFEGSILSIIFQLSVICIIILKSNKKLSWQSIAKQA